ncbi:ABC transporter substrate-binding protein [Streptomyces sp. NPDC059258]|uniref:ABC transporter substrate-binding protein n=1 Tax=unclassified Streptomyces TaxID=2593676 RepID=UPI0036A63891
MQGHLPQSRGATARIGEGDVHELDVGPGDPAYRLGRNRQRGSGQQFLDARDLVPQRAQRADQERLAALPGLGVRNPGVEALATAAPDLLITDQVEKVSGEVGSPSIADLERLGIATYVVGGGCAADLGEDTSGLEALDGDIRQLGTIFGVEARAEELADELNGSLDGVRRQLAQRPRTKVAKLSQVAGRLYVTSGGLSNDVIERAGGTNVLADLPGQFVPVGPEEIFARNPRSIIVDDFTATTAGRNDAIAYLNRTFPTVDAVRNGRVLVIDAAKTGARGSTRPVEGVTEIARFLHPSTSRSR